MAGTSPPTPPPWKLAEVFAYNDRLYELFGPVRSEWPPPGERPCPAGASGECTVCGGRGGNHYPWCGHAHHLPVAEGES